MGEASPNGLEGGHTWRPRIETCQKCHPGANSFTDIQASADWDGNGKIESAFVEIGGSVIRLLVLIISAHWAAQASPSGKGDFLQSQWP